MSVLIFANGEIAEVEWIRPYLAPATAVIAADGGSRYLMALGHRPDVVIGDLDSLSADVRAWLAAGDAPLLRHSAQKDETDLELALLYAVEQYADEELLLFGTLGGRLDQTLANILLLAHPALVQRRVTLLTERERAWLVRDTAVIHGRPGDTVSLIPLGGDVRVAQADGLQWPLRDDTLTFGPARGVSNVMAAERATVAVETGVLLCIHRKKLETQ